MNYNTFNSHYQQSFQCLGQTAVFIFPKRLRCRISSPADLEITTRTCCANLEGIGCNCLECTEVLSRGKAGEDVQYLSPSTRQSKNQLITHRGRWGVGGGGGGCNNLRGGVKARSLIVSWPSSIRLPQEIGLVTLQLCRAAGNNAAIGSDSGRKFCTL